MNFASNPVPEESNREEAEAIELLFDELAASLERIAWAILRDWPLAADAVQEAFALLAKKIADIPTENRRGWLVNTVQFQAKNIRRKQRRANQVAGQLLAGGLVRQPESEYRDEKRTVEATDEQSRLRAAIDELPESQQRVVLMRLRDEKTFAEIAYTMQLPLGTVLSRMRLALQKLRQRLKP